jgi:hypothetical protein
MVTIRFAKEYKGYHAGQVVPVTPQVAAALVEAGVATYHVTLVVHDAAQGTKTRIGG